MSDFDLGDIEVSGQHGIDHLLAQEPGIVSAHTSRRRVASLADLKGFTRISAETLIRRSEQDLWSINKESDGQFYIQRLFDDGGEPLKG